MKWLKTIFVGGRKPPAPMKGNEASVIDAAGVRVAIAALNAALASQASEHAHSLAVYRRTVTAILMKVGSITLSADLLTTSDGLNFRSRRDEEDFSITLELDDS